MVIESHSLVIARRKRPASVEAENGNWENALEGISITALVDRLFVYGTLRLGAENEQARELARSALYIGLARIRGRLFRVAHYPGLVAPAGKDEWVHGDLFEGVTATMIQHLDNYEGPEYTRQLAEVTLENGRTLATYLYLCNIDTNNLELISSGDWNAFSSASSLPE